MNIKESLIWSRKNLSKVNEPGSSTLVLLGEALSMSRAEILANPQRRLSKEQEDSFRKFVKRRKNHEPTGQIMGRAKFCGLDFFVNSDVLVPRPETEMLVEETIKYITKKKPTGAVCSNKDKFKILDVGTGSGAISVTVAHNLKLKKISHEIDATDISQRSLEVAKRNANLNGVCDKINFFQADIFCSFDDQNKNTRKYDVITANLPYIPSSDMKLLSGDIYDHEPHIALNGGRDGLRIYERFFKKVGNFLKKESVVFCEIGLNQGEKLEKIIKKNVPGTKTKILNDLAGINRIAIIKKH